jgi:hypothetical protein
MNHQNNNASLGEPFQVLFDRIRYGKEVECPHFSEHSLLEAAVLEVSEQVQVKRSMATFAALGAIASVCQGLIDIELPTGKRVPSSLMLLVLAESGERKTSLANQFFGALRQQELHLLEHFEEAEKKYKADLEIWSLSKNIIIQQLKKAQRTYISSQDEANLDEVARFKLAYQNHTENQPIKPRQPKFIYEDVTPAALLKGMQNHNKNACLITSEGSNVFRGHIMNDLGALNGFWDGNEVPVDRASGESFILRDARLTTFIMAQKIVIDEFIRKRGSEASGMGFWARFMVVKPEPMSGNRKLQEKSESPHLEIFKHRLSCCLDQLNAAEQNGQERRVVKFNASSGHLWKQYAEKIESEMRGGGIYEYHPDHASKLMDNISRIAGLLCYFESDCDDQELTIDVETLEYAYNLGMYCSGYYLKTLASIPEVVEDADKLVCDILKYLQKDKFNYEPEIITDRQHGKVRKGFEGLFNMSDVTRAGYAPLRNKERFERALFLLERLGHVERVAESYKGKQYKFCESIIKYDADNGPAIRNGEVVEVRSLPKWSDQMYFNPYQYDRIDYNRFHGMGFYILGKLRISPPHGIIPAAHD